MLTGREKPVTRVLHHYCTASLTDMNMLLRYNGCNVGYFLSPAGNDTLYIYSVSSTEVASYHGNSKLDESVYLSVKNMTCEGLSPILAISWRI
jgi:hypothetical protein